MRDQKLDLMKVRGVYEVEAGKKGVQEGDL